MSRLRHCSASVVVVHGQPAADVGEAVLLGAHGHAVGQRGHLPHDVGHVPIALARLALADEPGVLGEATGVEEQRHTVAVAHRSHAAQVLERDGLAAAGVVRHGHEHHGDVRRPSARKASSRAEVHVALERVNRGGVESLGDHKVDGFGPGGLDVGPGGVEVGVVRHHLVGAADDGEEDLLGRPPLVGGDHVREAGTAPARPRGSGTTTASRRNSRRPAGCPAHWSRDIAPVPESVSRSISTSSERRANRL